MKSLNTNFFLYFGILFCLFSCKDKSTLRNTYTANTPVYMSLSEFRGSVESATPQPLTNPGKIYLKDHFIFVNDIEKGIHIIDNSAPESPQNIGYINLIGNKDIEIKGNFLYADSYMDLVVLDISDIYNVQEVQRLENAFDEFLPLFNPEYPMAQLIETDDIVVAWEVKTITDVEELGRGYYNGWECFECMTTNDGVGPMVNPEQSSSNNPTTQGKSGSMARFSLVNNHLYAIDGADLLTFGISSTVTELSEQRVRFGLETLFPHGNKLFIGTTSGMLIYDLNQANEPTYVSDYNHVRSCDPVVVDGNYAYVTLRSGTPCEGFSNQLEVLDITDITNPHNVGTYQMTNPHGLGIDKNTLFLCDGNAGLKVFDITGNNKMEVSSHQIHHFDGINGFDVIPYQDHLLLIGSDGFYQYDYSDVGEMNLISKISVQ